jgi:NADPH:quinone reductase-like Zn-dependent oxidoreductase
VSFEQAASVPIAACTALQSLRDKCRIAPGQQVLVNGAAGGVGTFAVQIAKSYGAVVTAVCSGRNLELVRSIGADYAIDYTLEDFSRGGREYDAILDAVGNRGPSAFRRVMKPQGILAMAGGGSAGKWMIGPLLGMLHARLLSFGSRKFLGIFAKIDAPDLTFLGELMAAGKVTPVIDRRYPLSELPEAMRYVEEGHARGKVVIVVD